MTISGGLRHGSPITGALRTLRRLHHADYPKLLIAEAMRILKPGGNLLVVGDESIEQIFHPSLKQSLKMQWFVYRSERTISTSKQKFEGAMASLKELLRQVYFDATGPQGMK